MYVKIRGIDQRIQIRGRHRNNPVLLCLHGGPGASWLRLTNLFLPWEKEFTVVQWEECGTGKTLETTGSSIANARVEKNRRVFPNLEEVRMRIGPEHPQGNALCTHLTLWDLCNWRKGVVQVPTFRIY